MSDASDSIHQKGVSICRDGQEENCRKEPSPDGGENKKGGTARKAELFGVAGNEVSVHVGGEAPRISEEVKSTLLFTATSVIAGYASFILGGVRKSATISGTSLLLALAAMIIILLASTAIVKKLLGKKDMKWIMGNGGAIYLFLWFVSWIIFYNVL